MNTGNKLERTCIKKRGTSNKRSSSKRKRRNDPSKDPSECFFGTSKQMLLHDNKKEDEIIANLEKKLKLRKGGSTNITKSFCDDGLDYLLETCNRIQVKPKKVRAGLGTTLTCKVEGEHSESKINKHKHVEDRTKNQHSVSEENLTSYLSPKICSVWKVEDICQDNKRSKYLKMNEHEGSALERKLAEVAGEAQEKAYLQEPECNDKKLLCLKKQVKGLFNRLAEANMHKIAMQLEVLYRSNIRNSMNKVLVEIALGSLASSDRAPERLIQETAMLIAILHSNVDTSVGLNAIHTAIREFHTIYHGSYDDDCKKLDNFILFFAHLYNFKVVSDILVYDILNLLAENFSEKDIELILLLLRSVGISLRKHNSIQLKELILKLQKKASTAKEIESGCRVKYMLDVLLAIKNNNMQKIPNYDPDHMEHLKKLMIGFLHPGSSITQIKVSLGDILKAGEEGHSLQSLPSGNISEKNDQTSLERCDDWQAEPISNLAKKHRMNTDVRRHIFSILVTAEDYLDAFEKILRLKFKDQQDHEVMNLIVHCALQGKVYNPFYQFLACKFCSFNRKYLVSLQYSLWDKMEELNNLKKEQVCNLSRFISSCIIEKCLPLSSLKVLDFGMMNQRMNNFLKDLLLNILTSSSLETLEFICKRITSPKLNVFKESLWLYIKHIISTSEVVDNSTQANHLRQKLEMMGNIFGFN